MKTAVYNPNFLRHSYLFLGATVFLSACEPITFLGGGAAVTTSVAEERGIGGVISDSSIKSRIHMHYMDVNPTLSQDVDVVVRQGRVLLTGKLPSQQMQIEAVRCAWMVDGVQEVHDETTVGESTGFPGFASDSWITTQLKSKILFENDIRSLNYNVQTIDKTVYLMGIAQNQHELDRVIELARRTSGVKNVITYVRVKPQSIGGGKHSLPKDSSFGERISEGREADQSFVPAPTGASSPQHPIEVQSLDAPNSGSSFQ